MKRRDVLKALIIAPAAPAVIAKAMEAKPAIMEFHLDHISSLSRKLGPTPPIVEFPSEELLAKVREFSLKYWGRYGQNYYEPVHIGNHIFQTQP